jgi:hypothetical protein
MSATTASNADDKNSVLDIFTTACQIAMEKYKTTLKKAYKYRITDVVEKGNHACRSADDKNSDFDIFTTACQIAMEKYKTSLKEAYEYGITDAVEKGNNACRSADEKYEDEYITASEKFRVKSDEIDADFDAILLNFPEWDAKKKCDAAYEAAEKKEQNACRASLKGEITSAERDAADRESKEARLAKYKCDIAYNAAFHERKKEDDYKAAGVERDNAYKAHRDTRDAAYKVAEDKRNAVFELANKEQDETIAAIVTLYNALIKNNGA